MKKLNFLAVAAMLFAAMTLTGCDPTETPDGGDGTEIPDDKDGDGDGGGNNGDIRLVDKVTFNEDDGSLYGFQLFYDSQNRVTKLELDSEGENIEGEYMTVTYSYGANTFTINFEDNDYYDEYLDEGEEPYWGKETDNSVYNLDPEGRVVSQASLLYKSWTNGVLDDEDDEPRDIVLSYKNGYLKTCTYSDAAGNGEFTTSCVIDYFWENGNLIKTVETDTDKYVDDTIEDEVITTETTYTYSDKLNPANVSLDWNAVFLFAEELEMFYAEGLGFLGKPTKNLISSISTTTTEDHITYGSSYYDWELDSKGYITKLIETFESEPGFAITTTFSYKN